MRYHILRPFTSLCLLGAALLAGPWLGAAVAETSPAPAEILTMMERVGNWQMRHPDPKPGRPLWGWIRAAYTIGAVELGNLSAQPDHFEAMMANGRINAWQLGPRPYHADDHAIGQLYLALYARERDPLMIAATRARFDTILGSPLADDLKFDSDKNPRRSDGWSWCDALFMAPATWVGLGRVTGDARYTTFAVQQWWKSSDYLYDK